MMESKKHGVIGLFAALGDPTRFAVLETLMREGERSAGELQELADISPPAMSRHLRVLREANLVTRRIDGQKRIYAAEPEALRAIDGWALSHRGFWDAGLDRLAAALEARERNG